MAILLETPRSAQYQANWTGQLTTTTGTSVSSGGTAHTLSSAFVQAIGSTNFDTNWIEIIFHSNNASATITDSLVNVYVGAIGAEQLLIPNLLAGWAGIIGGANDTNTRTYRFPLKIPAGSRLSLKHQSIRVSQPVFVLMLLYGGEGSNGWTGTRVECVGADTSLSRGTMVTPGTTAEGTLTSLGTNTSEFGHATLMSANNTDTTMLAGTRAADIGISTAVIPGLEDFLFQTSSSEYSYNINHGRFCHIPASTALYVRAQGSAAAEAHDYCIYGVS